jgi:hypothetical protein
VSRESSTGSAGSFGGGSGATSGVYPAEKKTAGSVNHSHPNLAIDFTTPNPANATPTYHTEFAHHFGAASPHLLSLQLPTSPARPNIPPRKSSSSYNTPTPPLPPLNNSQDVQPQQAEQSPPQVLGKTHGQKAQEAKRRASAHNKMRDYENRDDMWEVGDTVHLWLTENVYHVCTITEDLDKGNVLVLFQHDGKTII